jgi:flagellum-specific peptidoglycan hydrolase FlgJ
MKALIYGVLLIAVLKAAQQKTITAPVNKLQYVLDTVGILNSKVVICQWVHETGIMKSKVYRENHNPFGMKESSRHWDIGTLNGHAVYEHFPHDGECNIICYMDAIYDYRDWQRARGWKGGTDEQYYQFLLDKHYAEDTKYIDKLRKYHLLIFNN